MADKSCWSQLPLDLYGLIFSKLQPKNILRFKAACRWSRAIVESVISNSPSTFACLPERPCLLRYDPDQGKFHFLCLEVQGSRPLLCNLNNNILNKGPDRSVCLGSSQGYLLFYIKPKAPLVLINPFSRIQLRLPPSNTLPELVPEDSPAFFEDMSFYKVVVLLPGRPRPTRRRSRNFHSCDSIGVLVLYNDQSFSRIAMNLAFSTTADDADKWTKLNAKEVLYTDVMSYDHNTFYASRVSLDSNFNTVEIWEFPDSSLLVPVKKIEIRADASMVYQLYARLSGHYIVKTREDLLLVVVKSKVRFKVFKLKCYPPSASDSGSICGTLDYKWIEAESIGNHVHSLILGANDSIIISERDHAPEFDENSIYFTSHWRTQDNSLTHRLSVYDLRKTQAQMLCDLLVTEENFIVLFDGRCQPPGIWIVPHPF